VVISKLKRFHGNDVSDIDAMVKRGLVRHAMGGLERLGRGRRVGVVAAGTDHESVVHVLRQDLDLEASEKDLATLGLELQLPATEYSAPQVCDQGRAGQNLDGARRRGEVEAWRLPRHPSTSS